MIESLKETFKRIYKTSPEHIFFAPGRVNLIGEHTDHSGGTILPATISQGTWLLAGPNDKNKIVLRSGNLDDYAEVLVSSHYRRTNTDWVNYPLGVISQFTELAGTAISGLNLLFAGDVPQGTNLSSSASITVLTAFALNELFQGGLDKLDLVKIAHQAELEFAGVPCSITEPYTVVFGKPHMALSLNCASLSHTEIPCKLGGYVLVMINTGKSRLQNDPRYNERFAQCLQALSLLQQEHPLQSLCELSPARFEQLHHLIPDPVLSRRARHVIEENARVGLAAEALKKGDIERLGQLMFDSHASLRELYEVSGKELDLIVELSQQEGATGARMTGTRHGGSALALVHQAGLKKYRSVLIKEYKKLSGEELQLLPLKISGEVRQVL